MMPLSISVKKYYFYEEVSLRPETATDTGTTATADYRKYFLDDPSYGTTVQFDAFDSI